MNPQIKKEIIKVTCAFCNGKGTYPFSLLSAKISCIVCGGEGRVEVSTPIIKCAYCKGAPKYKSYSCYLCGF